MHEDLKDMAVQRTAELEVLENEIRRDIGAVVRVAERFRIIKEERLCRNSQQESDAVTPVAYVVLPAARTITTMPARMASGRVGHASTTSASSPSVPPFTGCPDAGSESSQLPFFVMLVQTLVQTCAPVAVSSWFGNDLELGAF